MHHESYTIVYYAQITITYLLSCECILLLNAYNFEIIKPDIIIIIVKYLRTDC